MNNDYYIIILIIIIIFVVLFYNKNHNSNKRKKISSNKVNEHYTNNKNFDNKNFEIKNIDNFKECKKKIVINNDVNYIINDVNYIINHPEYKKTKPCKLNTPTNYFYVNIGCYNDNTSRMIPIYITNVSTVCEAMEIANQYGAPVFGIQNNGELYIGYEPMRAISLGLTSGPCNVLGESWINQVYVAPLILSEPTTYTYNYVGCFLDSPEHLIPILIGNVISVEDAKIIANKFGATVFGIQNNGDLYIGYDIIKAKMLGPSTIDYDLINTRPICNMLGETLKNQVYYVF